MGWSEFNNTLEAGSLLRKNTSSVLTFENYANKMKLRCSKETLRNHSSFPAGTERRKGSPWRGGQTHQDWVLEWTFGTVLETHDLLRISFYHTDNISICPFISSNAWLYHPCSHFETLVLSYFWVPELTMKLLSSVPLVLEWSQERWQESRILRAGELSPCKHPLWRWRCTVVPC